MKVLHAYCNPQHESAITPIVDELRRRGHEVKTIHLIHGTLEPYPDQEDVSQWKYDVFLNSYPHIMRTAEGKSYKNIRGKKVCVEHGVNPVAWAFPLDRHLLYDIVCVSGKWQADAVKRSGGEFDSLNRKLRMTGWPKVDSLAHFKPEWRAGARAALEKKMKQPFEKGKPVIVFAPTHSGVWWRIDELRKLGIPNLVVAPHEGRYNAFRQKSKARNAEINYAEQYPYYIETGNIHEVLKAADLVISDYSSALLEALVLRIPVLQILGDVRLYQRESISPKKFGCYPLSALDTRKFICAPNVYDIATVPKEIARLLSDPNYYKNERDFWRNEIFSNLGKATAAVCDLLEAETATPVKA